MRIVRGKIYIIGLVCILGYIRGFFLLVCMFWVNKDVGKWGVWFKYVLVSDWGLGWCFEVRVFGGLRCVM